MEWQRKLPQAGSSALHHSQGSQSAAASVETLVVVCLHCEHGFRRVKGALAIVAAIRTIAAEQTAAHDEPVAA